MRLLLAIVPLLLVTGCVSKKRIERAHARTELGVAYYREGSLEAAIRALRDAHELDPRNWRTLNALAVAYIAKEQDELAEQAFKKALRLVPDEAEVLMNYGAMQVRTGRPVEAVATLELALADLDYRNPSHVLSNLSRAHLEAGQPDLAAQRAAEAIRRTPQLCEAWFHLGLAQEARQDIDAALRAYDELIRACPSESLGARLRSGCVLVREGRLDIGRASLEEVIDEAAGTPLAVEAQECLATLGG